MKYIILGNGQEWCYYSWKATSNDESISFYNDIAAIIKNPLLAKICSNHFSKKKVSDKLSPIRRIWYRTLVKAIGIKKSGCVLFFYDYGLLARDLDFIKYIKKKYPQTKLVYLFSNIVSISGAVKHKILVRLNDYYDQIFAFDPNDAIKFGFDFSPLIYTRDPDYKEEEKVYDIFYVGNAKDRLDTLHEIYKSCVDSGLKCCFYINGVASEKQVYSDIHYNHLLSYQDVLKLIAKSRCMVDAIQGGSSAMTIKVCEAVTYDKKLITTNESIKQEPYFSPDRVLIYHNNCDINSFISGDDIVFSKEEKSVFSPYELFKKLHV